MRIALTPMALLIAVYSFAQPFERVEVVKVDSTRSAADLYRTAERWFVDMFKDPQEVIQLRDSVTHTIVGKGADRVPLIFTEPTYASSTMLMRYTVEVGSKNGRYRLRIYDVSIQDVEYVENDSACLATWASYVPTKYNKAHINMVKSHTNFCAQARSSLESLVSSLQAAMIKPKDDW